MLWPFLLGWRSLVGTRSHWPAHTGNPRVLPPVPGFWQSSVRAQNSHRPVASGLRWSSSSAPTAGAPIPKFAGDFFGSVLGFEGGDGPSCSRRFSRDLLYGWTRVPRPSLPLHGDGGLAPTSPRVLDPQRPTPWLQPHSGGTFSDGHFQRARTISAAIITPSWSKV